jgi:hypothetical protein
MDKDDLIRRALRFPIDSVIKLYMKHYGVTEDEAHEHELELKRYLALSALNRGKRYSLRAPIENLLLTFIVFTVLYSEFCISVAGGYIHYTPAEGRTNSDVVKEYSELLTDYELVFNTPPPHIWPRDAGDMGSLQFSSQGPGDNFLGY